MIFMPALFRIFNISILGGYILEGNLWLMLLLQVVLIALNAIFACAEIAVISVGDSKLEKLSEDGNKRAKKLLKLTADSAKFLATIQVAITLAGFLGSAFAAEHFSDKLTTLIVSAGVTMISPAAIDAVTVVLITLVLSYFTLVFGELVPKRIAMRNPEKIALSMAKPISFIAKLFAPIVWLLTVSTNLVLRIVGIDPNERDDDVSEEDIRVMVDSAAKSSSIDDDEREFIQNIFEFDDLTAGEVATHRTDVTMLWLDESDEEWSSTIHEKCHMFYPVCGESVDDVVGVLYLKDYFRLEDRTREAVIAKAVKNPYFVPESVKADVLFRNMKNGGKTFAVVLDEYGGMRGIVTMNDLISRLVGELGDDTEGDRPTVQLEKIGELSWKLTGNVPLDEIAEELKLDIPVDDFDTFSGMVFSELGTIPDDGSTFTLEAWGMGISEPVIEEHQIESAVLTRLEPFPIDEDDDDEDDPQEDDE